MAGIILMLQVAATRRGRREDMCMRIGTGEGVYLLVELRQVRLGSILDRHDGCVAGEELEVGCMGADADK